MIFSSDIIKKRCDENTSVKIKNWSLKTVYNFVNDEENKRNSELRIERKRLNESEDSRTYLIWRV